MIIIYSDGGHHQFRTDKWRIKPSYPSSQIERTIIDHQELAQYFQKHAINIKQLYLRKYNLT
jgi:N-dimethylarginine dimethylaminohydrolase